MTRRERTEIFFRRLAASGPCASADEALGRIADVLNGIEDMFTSIPFNPAAWESDGRLYPPQEDQRRDVAGHPDIRRYRSRQHNSWIADNGAIRIDQGGTICLEKPGADGRTIAQLMAGKASKP
jgi:hypothetical protein